MNKKEQADKKIIDILRNNIRDFVLTVDELKKKYYETYNVLKKMKFVSKVTELNKLALLDVSILKQEYLKEKNNVNILASHCLNESDYKLFLQIFEVENIKEKMKSLDDVSGVKVFLKKLNSQEMTSFVNKNGSSQIKGLSLNLVKAGQVKNLRDIDLRLIHDLMLNEGVRSQNKDGTPGTDDIQFKEILLKSFELLKGRVNESSLKSFINTYESYAVELKDKKIPIFENSQKDVLIGDIKSQLSKWIGKFGEWKLNIEEFSFLGRVLQDLKKYDTEHNYHLIMENKEKLNKILYFAEDQSVYASFLKLTSEPRLNKSPWIYSPEKQSEALNSFLDVASLMDGFTSSMKINKDIVLISKLDIPLCERAAFFAMYLEENSRSNVIDTDDMKIFLKQAEKLTKKTSFSYEVLVEIDSYLGINTVSAMINYEGFDIPKNKTCLEAFKVVNGNLESYVVKNTYNLKNDNKELIAQKVLSLKGIKEKMECFAALDGDDLILIPLKYKRIVKINFESKNVEFNSQKDFCDINILNEVFTKSMLKKAKHLDEPSLIFYDGEISFLKNIEIVGDKIQLSLIQFKVDDIKDNPEKAFPIIKKYISSEKELRNISPASDVETMLFMQNLMFAKNNLIPEFKQHRSKYKQ